MATSSLLVLMKDVAGVVQAYEDYTLTNANGTSLTVNTYPIKTNRTDASSQAYVGDEVLATSGTAPVPNPNSISVYDPANGVWTLSFTSTTNTATTAAITVFRRGVTRVQLVRCINAGLRKLRYRTLLPLSLLADADMEASGISNWTAGSATVAKSTTAGTYLYGAQSLSITATAALGRAQSATVNVDPSWGRDYYVQAPVRASIGTARLIPYDVTNSANIDSEDWANIGWGQIYLAFQLPATCEQLAIRVVSVADADQSYWDGVILHRVGAREMPLPSSITDENQVLGVYTDIQGRDNFDTRNLRPVHNYRLLPDESNPTSQFKLALDQGITGPVWIDALIPYSALSADTDTTFCDRDWAALAGAVELLDELKERPGQDAPNYRALWMRKRRELQAYNSVYLPMTTAPHFEGSPNVPVPLG